jgi:predicted RNA-binding Zn-ribbon protein involved in translation (DUF1610 family)
VTQIGTFSAFPESLRFRVAQFRTPESQVSKSGDYPLNASEGLSPIDPVIIPCPNCGAKITTVNAAVATRIQIPKANCDCGFDGAIEWVNPHFQDESQEQFG